MQEVDTQFLPAYSARTGIAMGDLNRRKGMILDATTNGDDAVIDAQVWIASCCLLNVFLLLFSLEVRGKWTQCAIEHAPLLPVDVLWAS